MSTPTTSTSTGSAPDSREFYRQLIAERGVDQATDFSALGQEARFREIERLLPQAISSRRWRLLDYGCNVGDLWAYLRSRATQAHSLDTCFEYCGVDREGTFIGRLHERFQGLRHTEGWVGDIMYDANYEQLQAREFDYVVASGVFSHADQRADHEEMFRRLWSLAQRGFIANFLMEPAAGMPRKEMLAYFHPARILEWLTHDGRLPKFDLRHGTYHTGNDFTIGIFR